MKKKIPFIAYEIHFGDLKKALEIQPTLYKQTTALMCSWYAYTLLFQIPHVLKLRIETIVVRIRIIMIWMIAINIRIFI